MSTISISLKSATSTPGVEITFTKLYELKEEWLEIFNESDNDLLKYLYDLLDSINNDVLRQNKIRYKQYQRQKMGGASEITNISASGGRGLMHNQPNVDGVDLDTPAYSSATTTTAGPSSTAWRASSNHSSATGSKLVGLSAQLAGADKVKLQLNRELNKLSPSNLDAISESVLDVFCNFIINHITANGPLSVKEALFIDKWNDYITDLWNYIINKLLTQANYSDTYFKFINRLIAIQDSNIMDKLSEKLTSCVEQHIIPKVIDSIYDKVSFAELENKKQMVITEMIAFMKNSNYLVSNGQVLESLIGSIHSADNSENIFNTLGRFVKFFSEMDFIKGRKMSRIERIAYDTLLLGLYDNFKYINELLQWEPINYSELEKRVYFTIGFFQDNKRFIQALDTDFYRDMECQLDSLRRTDNIPTSIKYKLFDCIDNFITARHASNK